MHNMYSGTSETLTTPEAVAQLLMQVLAPIGDVSYERRLTGVALLEDGVMFGFIDHEGTPYLRATKGTAQRFHSLGSVKHPEMPYWSLPHGISADMGTLLEVAYEAADVAHLAFSFDIDDATPLVVTGVTPLRSFVTFLTLAA